MRAGGRVPVSQIIKEISEHASSEKALKSKKIHQISTYLEAMVGLEI
jgi:hypothetical protein